MKKVEIYTSDTCIQCIKAKEYLNSFNDTPEKKLIEELTISLNKAKETEEKVQAKEKELDRLIAKRSAAIESLNAEKQSLREKAEKNIEKIEFSRDNDDEFILDIYF